jgi:hypothetical protein
MKVMAGYVSHRSRSLCDVVDRVFQDLEKKPNYKQKVNEELDRIESKAVNLNDLLREPLKNHSAIEVSSERMKSLRSLFTPIVGICRCHKIRAA